MKHPTSLSDNGKVRPTDWLTAWRFAIVLAFLILALFPGILFPGKTFVFRDFGIFTYPNAGYLHDCFRQGELPLWNPFCCCGIPFLAQWNMAALYPLSLFYILLPASFGLNCFFYAHLFLAGMGMYFLAWRWTGNYLAAAIAGVAFTFSGMSLNCLMWTSNAAGLAWMPWVVWSVEAAWLHGGRKVIVAALIGTAQMLTGAAEIILFTWLIVTGLLCLNLVHGCRHLVRSTGQALAVVVLVTLLSLVQLLPFLDLLFHSARNSASGTDLWSVPLSGWANFFYRFTIAIRRGSAFFSSMDRTGPRPIISGPA